MLFLILAAVLVTVLYFYLTRNFQYWELKKIKYVKPIPIFGNMLGVVTQPTGDFITNIYNKFPNERFFGLFQFTTPTLMVRDPELLKRIMIQHFDHFVDHMPFVYEDSAPLLSQNLFSTKGERWKNIRQSLTPVFTSSKMRMMFTLVDESAKNLMNYFQNQKDDLISIEMKDVSSRYTSDIIATVAFGIKCDSLKNRNNKFLIFGKELSDWTGITSIKIFFNLAFPKISQWLKIKIIRDEVCNYLNEVMNETINVREEKNITRPDLIHVLTMARKGKLPEENEEIGFANSETGKLISLTNEEITAQAAIFLIGGLDSTSSSISFTSYELAINPEIQTKLREEILKVEEPITYEKLTGMKYLDMVISESLRKWPSFAWTDRKCTKAFEIVPEKEGETGLKVEVGDVIWVPILPIQMDPKFFPEPEKFIPERFSEENKSQIEPFTYLPFGNGPRNCIGSRFAILQTKIFFYYVLKDFEIVPTSKTEIPLKLGKSFLTMIPKNGYHLGLKRLQQ